MLAVAMLLPLSCADAVDEQTTDVAKNPKIEAALCEFLANHEPSDTASYVLVYEAAADEATVVDERTYAIGAFIGTLVATLQNGQQNAVTDTFCGDDARQSMKAPSGKGWVYAGQTKLNLSAAMLGRSIANKIPKGKDVEIYLEHQKDGTYKVYYRIVK